MEFERDICGEGNDTGDCENKAIVFIKVGNEELTYCETHINEAIKYLGRRFA